MFPMHFISFTWFCYTIFASNTHTWVCATKFIYRLKQFLKKNYQSNEEFSEQVISCLNWCLNITFWAAASEWKKGSGLSGRSLEFCWGFVTTEQSGPVLPVKWSVSPSLCYHAQRTKASICLTVALKCLLISLFLYSIL